MIWENWSHSSWFSRLFEAEKLISSIWCPSLEESQVEERILKQIVENMGECDIYDENNYVESIEIAKAPPRKKQKQAKITSFLAQKS